MKILMISNNYYPFTGGVARSIDVTMQLLADQGHEVKLITYDFTGTHADERNIIRIPTFFRFKYRGKIMPLTWAARSQINREIDTFKPDIIHLHHPFLLGVYGLLAAKRFRIPVVFTHHTMYEKYIHYLPWGHTLARMVLPYYLRWFYKHLDGAIAPSQAVHRTMQTLTNKQCEIIPSSINPLYIQANSKKSLSKNRPLRLMTASRLVPEKNIQKLFEACALLTIPFQLIICGEGYLRKHLEHLAYEQYTFSREQIMFIGELNSTELAEYYSDADIFIFASQSETQGLVIGEAMACGTPVIAFRGPGVEDALQNGGGVLVEHAEEMAQCIEKLRIDFQQLVILHEESHHHAQQFYPDQCINKIINFYEIIVRNNNSR